MKVTVINKGYTGTGILNVVLQPGEVRTVEFDEDARKDWLAGLKRLEEKNEIKVIWDVLETATPLLSYPTLITKFSTESIHINNGVNLSVDKRVSCSDLVTTHEIVFGNHKLTVENKDEISKTNKKPYKGKKRGRKKKNHS